MRLIGLIALFALAACPGAASELASVPDQESDDGDMGSGAGSGGGGNAPIWACDSDADCVAAGATCCECPTYATGVDDPAVAACSEVECPGPQQCTSDVRAACESGTCVLACAPVACSNTCEYGFARDVNGCLTCECAAPRSDEVACSADSQCVRVDGDCCGCERGGVDTAVRAGTEQQHRDMLGCESTPQCPGVDTCVAGDAPHCIQGTCTLAPPLPAAACGRPDLAACAACTLNADDRADTHGVGICEP